jgi:hypothetical protein
MDSGGFDPCSETPGSHSRRWLRENQRCGTKDGGRDQQAERHCIQPASVEIGRVELRPGAEFRCGTADDVLGTPYNDAGKVLMMLIDPWRQMRGDGMPWSPAGRVPTTAPAFGAWSARSEPNQVMIKPDKTATEAELARLRERLERRTDSWSRLEQVGRCLRWLDKPEAEGHSRPGGRRPQGAGAGSRRSHAPGQPAPPRRRGIGSTAPL